MLLPNKYFAFFVGIFLSISVVGQLKYKGLSVVAPPNEVDTSVWVDIKAANANSACLMPYSYMRNGSEVIFNHERQYWGESDKGTQVLINQAHEQGMTVMLKPHLWIMPNTFTGHLTFENEELWSKWVKSYQAYIFHFADIAEKEKVELFCLATEMESLWRDHPKGFEDLIAGVKKRYKGKLTYAANWDEYDRFPYWNEFDFIGIDAYFPLDSLNPKQSWKDLRKELEAFSVKNGKPLLFTEFGYRNIDNPYTKPWESDRNVPANNTQQVKAYDAFFSTWKGSQQLAGLYVWKWFIGDRHSRGQNSGFTPQGKPAEKLLSKYFR